MEEKQTNPVRTCPQCGFKITDPKDDRCPRCYKILPIHVECRGCGKCNHQLN